MPARAFMTGWTEVYCSPHGTFWARELVSGLSCIQVDWKPTHSSQVGSTVNVLCLLALAPQTSVLNSSDGVYYPTSAYPAPVPHDVRSNMSAANDSHGWTRVEFHEQTVLYSHQVAINRPVTTQSLPDSFFFLEVDCNFCLPLRCSWLYVLFFNVALVGLSVISTNNWGDCRKWRYSTVIYVYTFQQLMRNTCV